MTKIATGQEFAKALSMLLRRDVKARPMTAPPPTAKLRIGGIYQRGDGTELGVVAVDLNFAARSGAALSMVPADVAAEQIRAGALDEILRENFAEVLNVLSRAFVAEDNGRVALKAAVFPPQPLPEPAPGQKGGASFEVDIAGYGAGVVSLRILG